MAGNNRGLKWERDLDVYLKTVNRLMQRQHGFGIDDIPDFDYALNWEQGKTPSSTVEEAIEAAGGF